MTVPCCGSCTNERIAALVAMIIARREAIALSSSREVPSDASQAASAHILPQHAQGLREQSAISLAGAQIAVGSHQSFLCSSYVHLVSLCCRCRATRETRRGTLPSTVSDSTQCLERQSGTPLHLDNSTD